MPVVNLQNFAGMIPIRDASLLPDNAASYCRNAFLYSGAVQGFREQDAVHSVENQGISAVYRIPRTIAPVPDFKNSIWLEFYDPYISVLRAPVIEDRFRRYYFFPSDRAAPNIGPYYNTLERIEAGDAPYKIGVSHPTVAPGLSDTGGTVATQEVRTYVYTWVSEFGEEGPPSPPSTLQGTVDGTWRVLLTPPSAGDQAHSSLASVNVYRTITAGDGTAAYFLAQNVTIDTTIFYDNFANADITGNAILPSTLWFGPPADLQGTVAMANGMLAGWSNYREVWFCEPYRPHAWPAAYAVVVDSPIVALAAVGTSLVILTEATPWVATGVTPGSVTLSQIRSREPCIARGSVAPAGEGVYYASPNGLMVVNSMGVSPISVPFIDKVTWNNMGIANFAASRYASAYLAFSKRSALHDNGIIIDTQSPNTLFSWLSAGQEIVNVYCDELSGSTFLVTESEVFEWNPAHIDEVLPYTWVSREWRFPYAQQFVGGIVYFDVPSVLKIPVPSAQTRNTSQNQDFDPATQYLLLKVFADKRLILVREIQTSGEQIVLPSGFKATYWKFEFAGQVTLREAKFATSVKELMQA